MAYEPIILQRMDEGKVISLCQRWKIAELSIFGSALRSDFHEGSDIDLLVTFAQGTHHGFFALARLQEELEEIFERNVDIVTRRTIERSRNSIRREAILGSLRALYVA